MGKDGKLTKIKSALKEWQSITKLHPTNTTSVAVADDRSATEEAIDVAGTFHPVYVGKCRRRYLVSSQVVDHPVFQVLVNKTDESDEINIACEVVLFDHLLWMLENADSQLESMDELVKFYIH
ncbi:auxin-responsive protein SAUR78-like [Cornus florida]|uniref:auxin-responsive protein SAUR78-like n=1 Tax=Cornus florida TaxID=4283 RepID=UPI00289A23A1|nr:auxin-responsive protein SAUR78-like [Cornus florida]